MLPGAMPLSLLPRQTGAAPLDLPRLVMRRALWVALGSLLLAIVAGFAGARYDTGQEIEGALNLARISRQLSTLAAQPDEQALAALRGIGGLRHLRLEVIEATAAGTRLRYASAEPPSPAPLVAAMLALNRRIAPSAAPAVVGWPLARPDGSVWQIRFIAAPQSEQREAMANLLALFMLLALCCALMLVVMQVNVRRAFRPLQPMLQAIARVEQQDTGPLQALPAMPIRELDAIAAALKHLATSLQQADEARRVLGHKVLTLQEDERQRLARDLHDEFGQRLTALRVDAAWLQKRVAAQPDLAAVVAGMSAQCALIQQDVRVLLARLHPLGEPLAMGEGAPRESLRRLERLLNELLAGWSAGPSRTRHELSVVCGARACSAEEFDQAWLPREVVLALYRITQEALTNVARHAHASRARVQLRADADERLLLWSIEDDGEGIADVPAAFQQGSGLAGIKERVWALGGELDAGPARPLPC